MEKTTLRVIIIIGIVFISISPARVYSQTRLGLHFTKEELDIWRLRAKSGPYKSRGDVAPNTPGDWERIISNKNKFLENPSVVRWTGPPGTGCVAVDNAQKDGVEVPSKPLVGNMQDAAFYALLFNDQNIKRLVKDQLLWQAKHPGVNFKNTNRWCGRISDNSPNFEIAIWGVILLYTYEYVEDVFTHSEKQVFLSWMDGFAKYLQFELDRPLNNLFSNRGAEKLEDYNYIGGTLKGERVYAGGYQTTALQKYYNNRRAHMMQFVGLMGIKIDNPSYVNSAKYFIKETLAFMCYPDGSFGELHRSYPGLPSKGLNYLTNTFGCMIMVADALARIGDFSMYDFKTSFGIEETKGTTLKSLEWAITEHGKYLDGKRNVYEKDGKIGDPVAKIDGTHGDWIMMNDATNFAIANMYYKNNYNKSIYMRTAPGIYPYPVLTKLASNGTTLAWKGLVGHTAGLFMYAQMEGKVWPYPSKTVPVVNKNPIVMLGPDKNVFLPVQELILVGTASDPDGSIASYVWTKVSGPDVSMTNINTIAVKLTNLKSGQYIFRLTVNDNKGAQAYDEIIVNVSSEKSLPTVSAGDDKIVLLPMPKLSLKGVASDADGNIVSYLWTRQSGPSITLNNSNTNTLELTNLRAGEYIFRLTVKDNEGNIAFDEVRVQVSTQTILPDVSAGADISVSLPLGNLIIKGTASDADGRVVSYLWTKEEGPAVVMKNVNTNSLELINIKSGDYVFRLTVKDNMANTTYDEVNVKVSPQSSLTLLMDYINPNCSNKNDGLAWVEVSGGALPYTYKWSNGASSNSVKDLAPGKYVVTVTDNKGMRKSSSIYITSPEPIYAEAIVTDESSLGEGGKIDISVTGGIPPYTYYWSNNYTEEDLTELKAGKYSVTITDMNGCSIIQNFTVKKEGTINQETQASVDYKPRKIFSPNGDGSGDETWIVDNVEAINGCLLTIFDESGRRIYQTNSYANNWDGTINGEKANEGGYFYVINCPDSRAPVVGSFRLIR